VHRLLLRHRDGCRCHHGPLLFGALIENASGSGDITKIAVGYYIGAALMVAGGLVEILLGVKAEGQALESIAQPLSVEDADSGDAHPAEATA